jgi:hypothetical protein
MDKTNDRQIGRVENMTVKVSDQTTYRKCIVGTGLWKGTASGE